MVLSSWDPGKIKASSLHLLCRDKATDPSAECSHGDRCKYTYHDVHEFLRNKPADLGASTSTCRGRFVVLTLLLYRPGPSCYLFEHTGYCPVGFNCRFGDAHIDRVRWRPAMLSSVSPLTVQAWLRQDRGVLLYKPDGDRTPFPETLAS